MNGNKFNVGDTVTVLILDGPGDYDGIPIPDWMISSTNYRDFVVSNIIWDKTFSSDASYNLKGATYSQEKYPYLFPECVLVDTSDISIRYFEETDEMDSFLGGLING